MTVLLVLALIFILNVVRQLFFTSFIRLCQSLRISPAVGVWIYSLLFLPGTIMHELSHFLIASLLGLRTGAIEFLPQTSSTGIRFGSVAVEKRDPFRSFLVGIAPTLVGLTAILFIHILYQKFSSVPAAVIIYIYATLTFASHTTPSREDLTYFIPFLLLTCVLVGFWWYLDTASLLKAGSFINNHLQPLLLPLALGTGFIIIAWLLLQLIQGIIHPIPKRIVYTHR